jgi:hypothetical protein
LRQRSYSSFLAKENTQHEGFSTVVAIAIAGAVQRFELKAYSAYRRCWQDGERGLRVSVREHEKEWRRIGTLASQSASAEQKSGRFVIHSAKSRPAEPLAGA